MTTALGGATYTWCIKSKFAGRRVSGWEVSSDVCSLSYQYQGEKKKSESSSFDLGIQSQRQGPWESEEKKKKEECQNKIGMYGGKRREKIWENAVGCMITLICCCCLVSKSCPTLFSFATPWTVAHQAPLFMWFPRREHWSGLPFPSPGESFQPKDQAYLSFISRCILYCWATREAQSHGYWPQTQKFAIPSEKWNQPSSVTQSCLTLWDPTDCSMPGLPVHHQLLEFTQTHVHWVGDAIQPSYTLSSPSPPTFNLSQHQGLFQWVSSLHHVAKVLEFQFQHQSFQWIFRVDFL